MIKRPSSVIYGRDSLVLQTMLDFYADPSWSIVDLTANKRRMWKGVCWTSPIVFCDIDPSNDPDIVCDFRDTPFEENSRDILVFDPPHLPKAASSLKSDQTFSKNYGLSFAPDDNNIDSYFAPFLKEAHRILKKEGLIFAKLKDFVHNHTYQWTLNSFVQSVKNQSGLTACDLIVKVDPSAGNMQSGRWKNAYHVRNAHCWWVIVRKGKCEPQKKPPPSLP